MREFVIYTRTTEEIVRADIWEIIDGFLCFKREHFPQYVAVFNMCNIDGFKEKL
jgi:hypothetical protein